MWARSAVLLAVLRLPTVTQGADMALKRSEVVFMYASDEAAYKAYQATFVGWGGADTKEAVDLHHRLGIRCTGSMWCLTPGAQLIHEDPELRAACAKDIEGKPVAVPWLFDHTYEGTPSFFGCTNSPAFRALCEKRVRECMSGGADGLHVDDHLGVASAASWFGGGLCDNCIAAFRAWLAQNASEAELKAAGVKEIEAFDYRDLIRQRATTREQYLKVQREIPLMDRFLEFHLQAAAAHIQHLAEVAAEAAGHPVLLSANAGLPNKAHTTVLPILTHVICEVEQKASEGTKGIAHAIEAYDMAERMGKPLAATAGGWDWAFVKEHGCEDLVRFWIALAYAHGQRFMVPHPKKQWCFNKTLGTHWYEAPIESYAPLYRFVRSNAQWLDDMDRAEVEGVQSPPEVLVKARRRGEGFPAVLHVLNLDYDQASMTMKPKKDVELVLPSCLAPEACLSAKVLSYDADPQEVPLLHGENEVRILLPSLRLWSLVILQAG